MASPPSLPPAPAMLNATTNTKTELFLEKKWFWLLVGVSGGGGGGVCVRACMRVHACGLCTP